MTHPRDLNMRECALTMECKKKEGQPAIGSDRSVIESHVGLTRHWTKKGAYGSLRRLLEIVQRSVERKRIDEDVSNSSLRI